MRLGSGAQSPQWPPVNPGLFRQLLEINQSYILMPPAAAAESALSGPPPCAWPCASRKSNIGGSGSARAHNKCQVGRCSLAARCARYHYSGGVPSWREEPAARKSGRALCPSVVNFVNGEREVYEAGYAVAPRCGFGVLSLMGFGF